MKTLNGQNMLTRQQAHEELRRVLCLPDGYGRNLDALWDCVTTMREEVRLVNAAPMRRELGLYGERLIALLTEAAQTNALFEFSWED